ncbi:DUF350 domain-containing protein [Methylocystis rosea]|uniref:DUF350 domain-containing protein n=1 Tax=Methylocystis rosea TaxID=173366 RepID=UPI0013DDEF2B|nr:DUF350 domain-containing protein [Methylocystis rosea]
MVRFSGAALSDFLSGLLAFAAYFAAALAFCAAFCITYVWLTPHREFELIVREHNASAAIALGGSLIGFSIALAGAIHNTQAPLQFVAWGFVAFAVQVLAYRLARLGHPGLSHAIQQNAIAAALWVAAVSISAGILSAACMSP